MKYFKLSKFLTPLFETPEGTGSWFGYYNYDTLNYNQTKMLAQRAKNDAVLVKKGMEVEIGYYDLTNYSWNLVGKSDSYNWPQGSMLQWLPGKGNENKLIYNLSKDNHLISRIYDISTNESRDINWAIYGLTPDGKKSIALDMERSYWCRAYHYESVANESVNVDIPENDGIFEIDLINNTRRRIIKIQDVINIDKEAYFDSCKHWLEHIMVSQNGKRFCFLHRFTRGELNNYETRLFIADIDGKNLQIIDGWRKYYWSHFGWNGDNAFTIYSYKNTKHEEIASANDTDATMSRKCHSDFSIKSIMLSYFHLLPLRYRNKIKEHTNKNSNYYQYYTLQSGQFVLSDSYKSWELSIDGHPTFTTDGRYMITDSYPDYKQYQRIIVLDTKTKKTIILGEFFAGLHNKPGSCDLHPKLCDNNNFLVVDTAYNGKHHMLMFKINWDIIKKRLK